MEGNIGISHIMMGVRKLYSVAILCARVARKCAFESVRGKLGQGRRGKQREEIKKDHERREAR